MLDWSLERVAIQSQCFANFWSTLLPNGQAFSCQAARYSTAGWTWVVQDLCQRDDLVRLALLANALGMLGEQSGQRSTIVEGWRAYGRALKMLARSLPTLGQTKGDELLTTSLLLAQYEVCRNGSLCSYSCVKLLSRVALATSRSQESTLIISLRRQMVQARLWGEGHHLSKEPRVLCEGARSSAIQRQSATSGKKIISNNTFIGRILMMHNRYIPISEIASDLPSILRNGSQSPGL